MHVWSGQKGWQLEQICWRPKERVEECDGSLWIDVWVAEKNGSDFPPHTSTPIATHYWLSHQVSCLVFYLAWCHRKIPLQCNEPSSSPLHILGLFLRASFPLPFPVTPKFSSLFPIKTASKKKKPRDTFTLRSYYKSIIRTKTLYLPLLFAFLEKPKNYFLKKIPTIRLLSKIIDT